jgi:hypothetical protein
MIPGAAGHILSYVGVGQVCAAGLEVHIGIANVGFAFAEGFYFGAVQHEAGFQLLKNMIVVGSRAILRDDEFARAFGILALFGFLGWLIHVLSFYPMARLNKHGRLAKVGQSRGTGTSYLSAGPRDWIRLANGTV